MNERLTKTKRKMMQEMSIYIAHTTYKNVPAKSNLHVLEDFTGSQLAAVKYFRKYDEGRMVSIDSPYYIAEFNGADVQQKILTALAVDSTQRIAVLLAQDHTKITSVYSATPEGLQLVLACDETTPAETTEDSS